MCLAVIVILGWMGGPVRAQSAAPGAEGDPVLAMLEEIRDIRADLIVPRSSVLGALPDPAGLAAAQPHYREIFSCKPPYRIDFTDEQKENLDREYRYYTITGGPRSASLTSLGVTGAYIREAQLCRELVVSAVLAGTPAEGKLQVDDIIIGANGRLFRDRRDPRLPMGHALYESTTEKLGGKLTLQLVRRGKTMNVVIDGLPVLPPYSESWPYDCQRSKRIADRMVRFVLGSGGGGREMWKSLFLLASGDDEALDAVRRGIYRRLKDDYGPTDYGHTWAHSYQLLNLTEYYLLTGDSNVLPWIDHIREIFQRGQSGAGGWGHRCPCKGYGEVNAAGGAALCALALARECGSEMDKQALAQNIRYFSRFIGAGVPYGDHNSGMRLGGSNNGKASMAAMGLHLLGATEAAHRWARGIAYMYESPEGGHAEGIFNLAWDPLAAALAPRAEFAVRMNNLLWYYELARTHEGGLRFFRGGHFNYPGGTTTALGLVYLLPRKKIYLTGAPKSVFAMTPPNDRLAAAAQQFKNKQWAPLKAGLTKYLATQSNPHREYARKLLEAYQRMEAHVDATVELALANVAANKRTLARQQLEVLERMLGEKRPKITAAYEKASIFAPEPPQVRREKIEETATRFEIDPNEPPSYDWEFIVQPAKMSKESQKEKYHLFRPAQPGQTPQGRWYDVDYPVDGWTHRDGEILLDSNQTVWVRRTFKPIGSAKAYKHMMLLAERCGGTAYLNGYKLANFREGEVYLSPAAVGALRPGANVLAVRLENRHDRPTQADFGLKASPPLVPDLKGVLDDI